MAGRLRVTRTTRQSASLVVHDEVKRGNTNAAPKEPLHGGGEAPALRDGVLHDEVIV